MPISKAPPVPPLFTHKTPRGTPSAAAIKKQITATANAKTKPKTYWQELSEILASHPDDAKPPTESGMISQDQLWLDVNARRKGVIVLPNGLQYEQISTATPAEKKSPCATSTCLCNYCGMLTDGTEFDSSEAYGGPVNLQPRKMIEGWCVAMQLMAEGDHWRLFVPPHLGYGDAGRSDKARGQYIPSGAALVFDLHISLIVSGPTKLKPVRPAQPVSGGTFVPSAHFAGPLPGYMFKSGSMGLGYYRDANSLEVPEDPERQIGVTERGRASTAATSAGSSESSGGGSARQGGDITPSPTPSPPKSARSGNLFERAPSPRPVALKPKVPPLAMPAKHNAINFSGKENGMENGKTAGPIVVSLEKDAIEAVNSMLSKLHFPTLKQVLEELGMPVAGEKSELTARLTESLTSALISGRRARSV